MLEYFFNILVMFGHVVWVDEYVIQIDYNTNVQKVGENVIYKLLKAMGALIRLKGITDHLNDP